MTNNRLSFEDFPNVCRLCSTKKDNLKLINHVVYVDILKNIINIKIELDGDLPQHVCSECIDKLECIHSFIDLCIRSEANLRSILVKHKVEVLSQEKDTDQSPFERQSKISFNENFKSNEHILALSRNVKLKELKETSCASNVVNVENKLLKPSKKQHSDFQKCGEHFNTRTNLYEHKKKNVACRIKDFKCTICIKTFFTEFKLKLHMRSHTKETPFECKICFKKFRFASNVNRHVDSIHKGLKPFKCDVCGKEFSRLERKIHHKNLHTNHYQHKCKYCGESFKYKSTLRNHEMDHKIKNGEISDLSEIKCDVCKKIFFSKSLLLAHAQIHDRERTFLCSVCGRNFAKKNFLDIHSRIHTGEKPFQCKECGKTFRHSSSYKTHTLFHTGVRCFKCDICFKTFKQSSHLKTHSRIHSREKPFLCGICGKSFSLNGNLKTHTRIHTGETPYYCSVCNKGFYDSSSMKKHEKSH